MSGVPLYFPDGVPASVRRIVDPDSIHKKVQQGLKDVEAKWKKLAPKADAVTRGDRPWWKRLFGQSLKVDHMYVMDRLHKPVTKWPRGLQDQQKDALRIVRRLRQFGSTPLISMTDWHRDRTPTEDEMSKAFKLLAKDSVPVARLAEAAFNDMLDEVGAEIEPLCMSVYGEGCDPGEGAEIVLGDIKDLLKIGRIPGLSHAGVAALQEFWSAVYGS
jgi:hypothetical protein